jgi:hypothetical protein
VWRKLDQSIFDAMTGYSITIAGPKARSLAGFTSLNENLIVFGGQDDYDG